jgi:hypothetical protein
MNADSDKQMRPFIVLLRMLRYVERKPLRAGLVERAEITNRCMQRRG